MNKPVADLEVRQSALNPGQSFIVQAPAGSGKTELLIQRYLKLLSGVDHPEEIIAITFTRKAAGEMRSRILAALAQAEAGTEAASPHQQQTLDLARAVLDRNRQQGWEITLHPGRLRIQTIDALCAVITRHMPLRAHLGAQPETIEDADELYEAAAIRTIACLESNKDYSADLANLFSHLDNNLPYIKTLLVDMLRKRDQWLPHVTEDPDRRILEQALVNLIEEKLKDVREQFPGLVSKELCELISYAAENLADENPDHLICTCAGLETLPGTTADALRPWQGIVELLLTASGSWRKQINVKLGFPPAGGNKLEEEARRQNKKRLEGAIEQLQKVEGMQDRLAEIRILPPPHYQDNEWEVVNALARVLKLASAQLRILFAETNQVDFNQITRSALDAMGTDVDPTELARYLDYQIKHILVDECQDISISQLNLLERLTAEWSLDDQRTLFLVGDPQQSIYRFREAEVSLFIELFEKQVLGPVPLKACHLTVNFRSEAGIIEWLNASFRQVFPGASDMTRGAVPYTTSVAVHDNTCRQHIYLYPFFDQQHQAEAEQIRALIKDIKTRTPTASIAILVRSRSHLTHIVPQLIQHEIRFRAVEIQSLITQPAVQDLLMLTRALLHPADRIAWLAVCRAPWCGLELAGLLGLFNDKTRTIWECLQQQDLMVQHHSAAKVRLNHLVNVLAGALANQQRESLRHRVEKTWCQLGGPATLTSEDELENAQTFFELLESLERGGDIEDLQRLMDEVSDLYAASDHKADASLQIMTIHKAKGLEFDHVILPGLGRIPRPRSPELLAWMLRHKPGGGSDLILGPIKEAGQEEAAIYQYLASVEKEKQRFEDARVLYVAATRAKKTLHLFGHAKINVNQRNEEILCKPESRSLLEHLWPVVQSEYDEALSSYIEASDTEQTVESSYVFKRLAADWQCPPAGDPLPYTNVLTRYEPDISGIEFEWAGETIRHIGLVVHFYLQHIAEQGLDHWSFDTLRNMTGEFKTRLAQFGTPQSELDWAASQVETALVNMIDDPQGQWILNNHYQDIHNEYPISGIFENRLVNIVIDRTFVDDAGIRWIIDYKTSTHEGPDLDGFLDLQQERYQDQLEKYATLMQQLNAGEIHLGLYFPILKGWRTWQFKPLND